MKEKVLIIGGGVAGLEAARELLKLGLEPIVVEKKAETGGHVANWHKLFPDMSSAAALMATIKSGLDGATVYTSTEVLSINKLKDAFTAKLSNGKNIVCAAVLMASGFKLFEAAKKEEYGYGIYDRVITNADLEAWMNGAADKRIPSAPKAIGFVHCVGSRDIKAGNSQCSKVCCTTAIKQAIEMKERFPDAEIFCFYMDLRLFGKKYEDIYINAQRDYNIHFIRGRVSEVCETFEGRLQVKAEDTLSGKPLKVTLDSLVLMAGMQAHKITGELAQMLHLEIDSDGFLRSHDNIYGINDSGHRGIFYAGACTGAKTIPETIAEARSAALSIFNFVRK